jgi:hypothetical protein
MARLQAVLMVLVVLIVLMVLMVLMVLAWASQGHIQIHTQRTWHPPHCAEYHSHCCSRRHCHYHLH